MEQTFNKTIDLIYTAKQAGVELFLNGEKLQLKHAENKTIAKDLLEEIRKNKSVIIDFLKNDSFKSKSANQIKSLITPFNRDVITNVPLSFAQERLWFIDKLEGSLQYHTLVALRLKGKLSKGALEAAVKSVIKRHEILRTVYIEFDGIGYQKVKDPFSWSMSYLDGSALRDNKTLLDETIHNINKQPFDLSKDFMLRGTVVNIADEDHLLVVSIHHIACDAWSTPIIIKEVTQHYAATLQGVPYQLPPLQLQFADYAVWERNHLREDLLQTKLSYWKTKLEGFTTLQLPYDFERPLNRTSKGSSIFKFIDQSVLKPLVEISRQNDCSLYMTLLAAFDILLYRYTNQGDISVGASIANRNQQEVEELVGFFVNTITLRNQVNGDQTFIELLKQVQTTTLGAYQHQDVPFEKVLDAVLKDREKGRASLFQVMLVLLNTPEVQNVSLGEVQASYEPTKSEVSKFDFTFFVNETANGLGLTVEYSTELFKEETIARLVTHFENLLKQVAKNPNAKIADISLLSNDEQLLLTKTFGISTVDYPQDQNIISLFEQKVANHPNAPALECEGIALSYNVVNEQANQIAHYLRSKGVTRNSLVPLLVEPGLQMVVSILGILKAGGGYVPIDTNLPAERIQFIITDVNATVAIVSSQYSNLLHAHVGEQLHLLDPEDDILSLQPKHNPQAVVGSDHLAYIIYTSGSTGTPKGVTITHGNIVDYYYGLADKLPVAECKSFALLSSTATDLGNTVLFGSLLSGGVLHVFKKDMLSNAHGLHTYFQELSIDCIKIVPSHWKALQVDDQLLLPNKLLIFGGEVLYTEMAEAILVANSSCTVVNHYGPTETTIGKLLHVVGSSSAYQKTIPIGKPFGTTVVYVLDGDLQPAPLGVPARLYIGGKGLSKGYLNNEDLTRVKFISNPFNNPDAPVLYDTGDLVKYGSDGNITFINRADDQVKIRGYRVELGEIETALQSIEEVEQAVVLYNQDKSNNGKLVAYIVSNNTFDKESIIDQLRSKLPDYMVPSQIISLEALPLMVNGKVDRRQLKELAIAGSSKSRHINPKNDVEERLAKIWMNVLELESISMQDDFFEQGGHSLLAIRLVSAIRKEFNVEVPIGHIFDYPTIALLAEQINDTGDSKPAIVISPAIPRPSAIPMSYSQERLWLIDQLSGSRHYHIPAILNLKGDLNIFALKYAFKELINRHEALRTVFREINGTTCQVIQPNNNWDIEIVTTELVEGQTGGLIQSLIDKPFDLRKDYMIRASLINPVDDTYLLIITLHHIASDAWSTPIMVRELEELYNSKVENRKAALKPLPIQYADYAIWQRTLAATEAWNNKVDYWKQKLTGVTKLNLPVDFVRPVVQSTKGAMVSLKLNNQYNKSLQQLSKEHGATMYMTLLAAFKVLLHKYTGQNDICVGTPVAERQYEEIQNLIGFFVNTLAIRSGVDPQKSFTSLLSQVKTNMYEANQNQDIPFEKVVESLVQDRDISRNPLIQVVFSYQNVSNTKPVSLKNITVEQNGKGYNSHHTSKFDITFNITETTEAVYLGVEYCTDLFKEHSVKRMMIHFDELLASISVNPDRPLAELSMISDEEKAALIALNNQQASVPDKKSIIGIFEDQVKLSPSQTALTFEEQTITYRQLNELSNKLANQLNKLGLLHGDAIALLAPRGMEMIVSILGILKLGCTYVPLNVEFPDERLEYIIRDAQVKAVVHTSFKTDILQYLKDIPLISIKESKECSADFKSSQEVGIAPTYIMYTSGTTGKPKGIAISNQSVLNIAFQANDLKVLPSDKMLQWSNYAFDGSVFEIFGSLLNGATLCLLREGWSADTDAIAKVIVEQKISICFVTTAIFNALIDADPLVLKAVRKIFFGGEAASSVHVRKAIGALGTDKIFNIYGPTETTVFATYCPLNSLSENEMIPIGKPLDNTKSFVLDGNRNFVPVGVAGELYIGGMGLSLGYVNNQSLTKEKFVEVVIGNRVERLYKTGDVVKWNEKGMLEFFGRIDDQVKIRGYRIEPSEIENILQENSMVKNAVIIVRDQGNFKAMIAYLVPGENFNKQNLINWLQAKVPDYMVPAYWMITDKLPLNTNGKVDKNALPPFDINNELLDKYVAPRSELEIQLVHIWQTLLGIKKIGVYDNFFEIGGDSILTLQFVNAARRLSIEIHPRDVFIHQNIDSLTKFVNQRAEEIIDAEQGILSGSCGLLPIQQWYLNSVEMVNVSHFNQAVLLCVNKIISVDHLNRVWQVIFSHHDALRFKIRQHPGSNWEQTYNSDVSFAVIEETVDKDVSDFNQYISDKANYYQRSLDIFKGDIIRVILFKTPDFESENRLLVIVHHLAVDGVSWRVIAENLDYLLSCIQKNENVSLGKKGSSYRQWHLSLSNYGRQPALLAQGDYWKNVIESYSPLNIGNNNKSDVRLKDMHTTAMLLSPELTNLLLHEVSKKYQTEINDVLLSALANAVSEWGKIDHVTVGLEGHGRVEIDEKINLSNTVGWFTTIYPLVLTTNKTSDWGNMLVSVKNQLRQIPDKGIGYGVLKYMNKDARFTTPEKWNVIFNYLGQLDNVVKGGSWISPAKESTGVTVNEDHIINEELSVNCFIKNGQLITNLSFNSNNFSLEQVKELLNIYNIRLQALIEHCTKLAVNADAFKHIHNTALQNGRQSVSGNKYLVPIKSTGTKIPLYIVAGGGGTANKFMRFARMMDKDQPVYAIQPPIDVNDLKTFPDTIEGIASKFISEIFALNPDGPYALAGHCTGGKIALEMAKQLQQSGKKVHLLAMFDTLIGRNVSPESPSFKNLYHFPEKIHTALARLTLKFDFEFYLLRNHPKKAVMYKLQSLKNLLNKFSTKSKNDTAPVYDEFEIFDKTSELYTRASRKYTLEQYDGEILLFYAKERYYFTDAQNKINFKKIELDYDSKYLWKEYASSVILYEVKGDHSDIFEMVHGDEFAMLVQKHLDKTDP